MLDLKQLVIDTKSVWMEYPGFSGFEVEVTNLSRKELEKLRKRCTVTKFDRATRTPHEDLDGDKFAKEFSKATIKNWKGLKLDYLQSLILINTEGLDLEDELDYSEENAEMIVTGSIEFNGWLNEVVFDLDNFRDEREGKSKREPKKAI
jgi:hypothetical protein